MVYEQIVASALALEGALKTDLLQAGSHFTVSAPAVHTPQSGKSTISISLSVQTGQQTAPEKQFIELQRAFFQSQFATLSSLQEFLFKDIDVIDIVLSASSVITKWQLHVEVKAQGNSSQHDLCNVSALSDQLNTCKLGTGISKSTQTQ